MNLTIPADKENGLYVHLQGLDPRFRLEVGGREVVAWEVRAYGLGETIADFAPTQLTFLTNELITGPAVAILFGNRFDVVIEKSKSVPWDKEGVGPFSCWAVSFDAPTVVG